MSTLHEGMKAPLFSVSDESGKVHDLISYKGKKIVLYFYPKDNTPGCTSEACHFRDSFKKFVDNDIIVLGVSSDSSESHARFKKEHNLPFTLLSDPKKEIIKMYGADGLLMTKRMTFLLDEELIIVKIFENVDVVSHAEEVLNFFQNL